MGPLSSPEETLAAIELDPHINTAVPCSLSSARAQGGTCCHSALVAVVSVGRGSDLYPKWARTHSRGCCKGFLQRVVGLSRKLTSVEGEEEDMELIVRPTREREIPRPYVPFPIGLGYRGERSLP